MKIKGIVKTLGYILLLEAVFLLPSLGIALYDGENHVSAAIGWTILLLLLVSAGAVFFTRKARQVLYAREGFIVVSLSWIVISLFGAFPFFFSGEIPNYVNAFFESVSGFTTTGASVISDIEKVSRALIFWRSLTQWLGGMGILVFMLAVLPTADGNGETLNILRAEAPGPDVEKIVPKIQYHAAILYGIYVGLTLLCFIFLLFSDMPMFDTICITLTTAGTGGFSVRADSIVSYSVYAQAVIVVFVLIFGTNFNIFFYVAMRKVKRVFFDEEFRAYILIILFSTVLVALNIAKLYGTAGESLRHAAVAVSGVVTSAGYFTSDHDKWPEFSRSLIVILMIVGSSAGSTGGGMKISRVILLLKNIYREMRKLIHPHSVILVRMNKRVVSERVLHGVSIFTITYALITILSILVISVDNFSLETNVTAVISCMSNIGPGLGAVGPVGHFEGFSVLSKLVLSFNMLIGRLEIFPLILLLHYKTWRKSA